MDTSTYKSKQVLEETLGESSLHAQPKGIIPKTHTCAQKDVLKPTKRDMGVAFSQRSCNVETGLVSFPFNPPKKGYLPTQRKRLYYSLHYFQQSNGIYSHFSRHYTKGTHPFCLVVAFLGVTKSSDRPVDDRPVGPSGFCGVAFSTWGRKAAVAGEGGGRCRSSSNSSLSIDECVGFGYRATGMQASHFSHLHLSQGIPS